MTDNDSKTMAIITFVLVILALVAGLMIGDTEGHAKGYQEGQIDALKGKFSYQIIEGKVYKKVGEATEYKTVDGKVFVLTEEASK